MGIMAMGMRPEMDMMERKVEQEGEKPIENKLTSLIERIYIGQVDCE